MLLTKYPLSRKLVIFTFAVLLFVATLLGSYNRTAYAFGIEGTAARVIAGSLGEKVLAGVAEKAGVKYLTKNAREKAFDKWNMEMYEQYTRETAENKLAYDNMLKAYNQAQVTPIPEKPGYGKVVLSGLAFLTGADLLLDSYNSMNEALLAESIDTFFTDVSDFVDDGHVVYDLPDMFVTNQVFSTTSHQKLISYIKPDGKVGTIGESYDPIKSDLYWQFLLGAVTVVNGVPQQEVSVFWSPHYKNYTDGTEYITNKVHEIFIKPIDTLMYEGNVQPEHLPNLDIPTQLQPYLDNEVDPIAEPVPQSIPEQVEIIVPIDTPLPEPTAESVPINEPLPDSVPEPVSETPTDGGDSGTPSTPTEPIGDNPFKNLIPVSLLLALLDLLRAILSYLGRMFEFIGTIPLIPSKPIENTSFEWFKNAEIIGIKIYDVISTLASIGLSFAVYKSVRRILP